MINNPVLPTVNIFPEAVYHEVVNKLPSLSAHNISPATHQAPFSPAPTPSTLMSVLLRGSNSLTKMLPMESAKEMGIKSISVVAGFITLI